LKGHGWENASPIQELTITPVLEGQDIFAQAETGSGKTGAFAIPIIEKILRAGTPAPVSKTPLWVILSPTRELAQQTDSVFDLIGKPLSISTACVIGGESMERQIDAISKGAHVLVATPGRLCDLIKQNAVNVDQVHGVVFDEADRLFDMGFKKDIEFILNKVPNKRQLIMVSATTNLDVLQTAYKFHSQPLELKIETDGLVVDKIDHRLATVSREEKFSLLIGLLRQQEDAYAIVFCNTQFQTHSVAEWLVAMGFKAKPISGRLPQNKRTKLMEDFRAKNTTILVCTDVAARGLDIKKVNLVINYDLPQEAANYVHRIGRTGRAGEEGLAVSFCAFEDCEYLDPISKLIGSPIPKMELSDEMFAKDLCRKPYINRDSLQLEDDPRSNREPRNKVKDMNKTPNRDDKKRNSPPPAQSNDRRPMGPISLDIKPFNDKREFAITSNSFKEASAKALDFWRIKDEELLGYDVTAQGRKKFFFFGPRSTSYKFFLKPIYKKLLTPFIEDILLRANLSLQVRVSFKAPLVKVTFSGEDEAMLNQNQGELILSFEHLIKEYLVPRVRPHRGLVLSVCAQNDIPQRSFDRPNTNDRGPRQDRGDDRSSRPPRQDNNINEQALVAMAEKTKQEVLNRKEAVVIKALSPAERRIVHQYLSDDPTIKTRSIGDGRFKKIEISLQ
jgi:superfamily II DNA/RNA helicase